MECQYCRNQDQREVVFPTMRIHWNRSLSWACLAQGELSLKNALLSPFSTTLLILFVTMILSIIVLQRRAQGLWNQTYQALGNSFTFYESLFPPLPSGVNPTYLTALIGRLNELLHRKALVNGPGHKKDTVCSLNSCLSLWDFKFLMKGTLESLAPSIMPDMQ